LTNNTSRLTNAGALENITGYTQTSGNFDMSGSTTGTFSTGGGAVSLNGSTTIASGKNLTITSGNESITSGNLTLASGKFSDTFTSSTNNDNLAALALTNNSSAGSVTTNALNVALTGATTSGSNTINGINFPTVTAVANNTINGIVFGSNYDYFLNTPSIKISGAGAITGATGVSTSTLNASSTVTLSSFSTDKGLLFTNGSGVVAQTAQGATGTVLHGNGTSAPSFSAVSLTADVSGVLSLANGGTNKNMTASAGSIVFSDADSFELSSVGTAGQVLLSGATSAPTWTTGTLTLDGNFAVSGANAVTLTTGSGGTTATIPTGTVTLADLGSTQTFTGAKTFNDLTVADTTVPFSGGSTTFDINQASTSTLNVLNSNGSNTADLNLADGRLLTNNT
jgi:hypothetical protein